MKFALLGLDDDTKALCRSILASDDHSLVACCSDDDEMTSAETVAAELTDEGPSRSILLKQLQELDLASLSTAADAVIVSRTTHAGVEQAGPRFEQTRFLARQRAPLIVSQPINISTLDYYELEMLSSDSGGTMLPLVASHTTDQIDYLIAGTRPGGEHAQASPDFGTIEQIVMHRYLTDRSRHSVMENFARDAILLSRLCGEVKSVAAMGPEVVATKFTNLNVQMSGADGRLVHWSIEPATDACRAQLTVVGSRRTLTLDISDYEQRDRWRFSEPTGEMGDFAQQRRERPLADVVAIELRDTESPKQTLPTWRDATRGIELAEAAITSLKKGRTIKLRAEGRGEEEAFKGTMAALGCGILIGTTALLFGLSVVMFVARTSNIGWLNNLAEFVVYWPYALLGILVAFLLIQLLRFLIPAGNSSDYPSRTRQEND